jgi:O-antigen/teichoic acid export membrane protein
MSFAKHSMQMLVWRAVTMLVSTATVILLARWLGPVDRGDLAIYVLSVSLAALVIQFGLPEAMIFAIGAKQYPERQITSTILTYSLLLSLLVAAAGYLVLVYWLGLEAFVSGLLLCALVLLVIVTIIRHVLLARKEFGRYSISVIWEMSTYLAVLVLMKKSGTLSVEFAVLAYMLSQLSALLFILISHRREGSPLVTPGGFRPEILGYCYKYGLHLFITGIGSFGARRINFFLLESILGSRAVGLFAAANSIPTVFSNLPQQLGTVLYSHVASASSEDYGVRLTIIVFKVLAGLSAVLIVPVAVFAEPLVILLFGLEFEGIARAMVILTVGMASAGLGNLLFNYLAGTGLPKYGSHMTFINVGLVTLLAFMWIPTAGVEGAAWAQSVTSVANLVFVSAVFCRRFKVRLSSLLTFSKEELMLLRMSVFGRG